MQQGSPSGRMIHTQFFAGQDAIKGGVIFAKVMEKASHIRRRPQPEGCSSLGSQSSRIFEMVGQQLPIASILTNTRMRIVFQNLHSPSRRLLPGNDSSNEYYQRLGQNCSHPQTSAFLGFG